MSVNKPKILLYWGYHRKAWTLPFDRLSNYFDFVYAFHYSPEDEILSNDKVETCYFQDFKSARHLLSSVNPSKVIFIGLDGMLSISINIVARRLGIKTIYMQHGFVFNFKDEVRVEHYQSNDSSGPVLSDPLLATKRKHYFRFIVRSLGVRDIFTFVQYMLAKLRTRGKTEPERMRAWKSTKRQADQYLLFAPFYLDLYQKRDYVDQSQVEYFGSLEIDEFLDYSSKADEEDNQSYLLLIDQPLFHEHELGGSAKCTYDEALKFYSELNEFSKSQGYCLKIKLHPYSYSFIHQYPTDENIELIVDDTDLKALVNNSQGVFGFYSTLILPAIMLKPTCLFKVMDEIDFFDFLESNGFSEVQPLKGFDLSEFTKKLSRPYQVSHKFVEHFSLSSEGGADRRLRSLLEES